MEFYVLLIVVAVLLTLVSTLCCERASKVSACILLVVLAFISGFRGVDVGSDTSIYYNLFLYIGTFDSLFDAIRLCGITAPVYVAENWFIALSGGNYRIVLFVNAVIISYLTGRFIFKTSVNPCFSVLCFILLAVFFQSMNGMRQYLAIVLAMNAFLDFYGGRGARFRAVFLLLAAVLVHSTAAVCLPGFLGAYLMRNWPNRRIVMIVTAAVSAVLALCAPILIELFVRIVPYYSMYDGTINTSILSNDYGGRIAALYLLLMCVCVVDYFAGVGKNDNAQDNKWERYGLYIFCIIAVVMGLIFCRNFLINRLLWFYMFPFISYIPNTIARLKKGDAAVLTGVIYSGLFIWCMMQLIENKDEVLPSVFSLLIV